MECDDFMLLLAKADAAEDNLARDPAYAEHFASCSRCAELAKNRFEQDGEDEGVDELLGQEIGVYRIQRLLGAGGMGRVYLATHPEIMSRVAIKVFSKDWNAHPNLVRRFFAEARATNVIGHENIVNVLDVGRLDDGRPYMVMEHLAGEPLSALVGGDALSDAKVVRIMLDVLSALSAAHEHGIIHRDLKPDNIFVSPQGRATLLDFGIAKLVPEATGTPVVPTTATGLILGTPHYMSPEQAKGDDIDTRTDVYALGVILYECLTGRRPFAGSSTYLLLDQHVNVTPRSPKWFRPDLSDDIESIVLRALAKMPDDRFESVATMREALEECAASEDSGAFLVDHDISLPSEAATAVGSTAQTVVGRRPKPDVPDVAEVPPRGNAWKAGLAMATILGAALLLWQWPSEDPRPPLVTAIVPTSFDAAPAPLADASPVDPLDAMPVPTEPDASIEPDASSKPVVPSIPKRKPKKLSGVAPFSFLEQATRIAREDRPDATLARIDLQGVDTKGRVDTSLPYRHIFFDFMSPRLVHLGANRKFSSCLLRVRIENGKPSRADRLPTQCSKLAPVQPPRCTMASLLRRARREGTIPKTFEQAKVTLKTSSRARPFWKLTTGGANYSLPFCP